MSILILSEHPTLNEGVHAFSNGHWRYFKAQLSRVGIDPRGCSWANCIDTSAANFFSFLQKGKAGSLPGVPYITKGFYLRPELGGKIARLREWIKATKPNLILAVGDLPLTLLTHQTKMQFARGRITTTLEEWGGTKVLPVYHPSKILADQSLEPILIADLHKAKRQAEFPEVRRPQRWLHLRPTIEDLEEFWQTYIEPSPSLSMDIETKGTMITCVGVAPSPERCLVIPFFDEEQRTGNYWATSRQERIAWQFVHRCLNTPGKTVFGQNFAYDAQYLWRQMGIPSTQWTDDTMVLHHALQPEMMKGLGFLASIYSEELAWKFMAKRRAADRSGKKEDI